MYSENYPNAYQKPTVPPPPLYGQPAATGYPVQQGIEGPWSSDLCDCFSDVPSCCLTYWCPCITYGRIADIVDKGSPTCGASGALYAVIALLTGCSWIYSCFNRSKMRRQYMLQENPCSDCCVHFWCEKCALCQEYRELESRGFDMSLGWQGNLNRQNQEVAMSPTAPMMEQGMRR